MVSKMGILLQVSGLPIGGWSSQAISSAASQVTQGLTLRSWAEPSHFSLSGLETSCVEVTRMRRLQEVKISLCDILCSNPF